MHKSLLSILEALALFCQRRRTWLPWIFAILAMLVTSPSLKTGFCTDDRLFQLIYRGTLPYSEIKVSPLNIFAFSGRTVEDKQHLMDRGLIPWWTGEGWKTAFWRPLSAFTHWLDWQLFGEWALPMHIEGLLLYGVLVALLTVLYLRFFDPPWVAGLAGLLYLLDAAHGMPVGWLANRNAVLAAIFSVLVLYFHDRWRRDDWKPGMGWALFFLIPGLLSGESGVAVGGYLAAYALFLDTGKLWTRFARLLPYLLIVILWQLVYKYQGFGVSGSNLYIDPVHEPFHFASRLLQYLPILLFSQFAAGDCMLYNYFPPLGLVLILIAAYAFLIWITWLLWPVFKHNRVARYWAVGMVLATLPSCAAIPQSRTLFCTGIGGMALVALFLHSRTTPKEQRESSLYRTMAKTLVCVWVMLHLVVSTIFMPISTFTMYFADQIAQQETRCVPDDPHVKGETLVVVNALIDVWCPLFSLLRAAENKTFPAYCRQLVAGVQNMDIMRTDDKTLILYLDNEFLNNAWNPVFRNLSREPFHAGQIVQLPGMHVKINSVTPDGTPISIEFRFDVSLDDPSLRWIAYQNGLYGPFKVPGIGKTCHIVNPDASTVIRSYLTPGTQR